MAQSLALFVKTIRKMTKSLQEIQKADIASALPDAQGPTSKALAQKGRKQSSAVPTGSRALEAELNAEGNEVLEQLKQQQKEVIDSLDLKQ